MRTSFIRASLAAHAVFLLFGGCELEGDVPAAADEDSTETSGGKSDDWGGTAARIFYTCETATMDQRTGAWWRYRTNMFNNTSDTTNLWIIKENPDGSREDYGAVNLDKIGTDTWSTSGISLMLRQKGAGKSIRVEHGNVGLVAGEQNGWCESTEIPDEIEYRNYDWSRGHAALTGSWELVAVDGYPVTDVPATPVFDMSIGSGSDPHRVHHGTVDFLTLCSGIVDPGGSPASAPANAGGLVTIVFRVFKIVHSAQRAADCLDDGVVQASKRWLTSLDHEDFMRVPTKFFDMCGENSGPPPLYASLGNFTGGEISLSCIHLYEPEEPGAAPYFIMRSISHEDYEITPWVTMVAR